LILKNPFNGIERIKEEIWKRIFARANPFNGIERELYFISLSDNRRILGIHSMELKGFLSPAFTVSLYICVESIQWN